jgi:hypothetical protein
MSDWSQLSLQDYELNYILQKFGKRETENNRRTLRIWEKAFKEANGGQHTKSYTKDEFYSLILGKIEAHLE